MDLEKHADAGSEAGLDVRQEKTVRDLLLLAGVLAVWFALQMWILPKFGIST